MDTIKIIGRINKNKKLFFCAYNPLLDGAIDNFRIAKTVKVLHGTCYIKHVSLGFFTELLDRDKVKYSVITTLN